jgi:peptide deformylase
MRDIVLYGRDVLREQCRPLEPGRDDDLLKSLLEDMKTILREHDGLGLAGPQAGEPVRVFIAGEDTGLPLAGHTVFVNPVLESFGPVVRGEEGCLSFPGIWADVDRSHGVLLRAMDRNWEPIALEMTGLAARLAQHEFDHLEGVLLVDRMGTLKRKLLRNRLRRIREESC